MPFRLGGAVETDVPVTAANSLLGASVLVFACAIAAAGAAALAAATAVAPGVASGCSLPALARAPTSARIFARRELSIEASAAPSAYGTRPWARSNALPLSLCTKSRHSLISAAFGL